jgi:glutaredoxin
MVKGYLKSKGVPFEDVDVSVDMERAMEMVRKTGQMGVPVTVINGEAVIGYDRESIDELLAKNE